MSILQPEESKPYTALYRQWRPQLFAQVVGQEHVTRTLQNALEGDRVAHAYLFCGLRGTGKTTMAKLLAKALNCLEGVNREPCNNCRACREITEGRSMDVQEIDAASNRGIDEIRELREKVRYAAAQNRYKVYIIDEVHMLTNEAFNALLKTLEEPPSGVVFILATTEIHKLPLTIVSRCQRFDFHLLQVEEIAGFLGEIASQINFAIEKETLYLLARLAEGALRDALGFLEQCRAFGGEEISYAQALEILGLTAPEAVFHLLQSIVDENIANGLFTIQEIVQQGRDLHRFIREMILYLRKLVILQAGAGETESLKDVPGLKPLLLQQKNVFTSAVLLEMLEILQQLTFELKGSAQPQFLLELAFLRLVRAYRFRDYFSPGTLLSRLEDLDEKLQSAGLAGLAARTPPLPPVGAGKVPAATAEILATSAAGKNNVSADPDVPAVAEKKELIPGNPDASPVPAVAAKEGLVSGVDNFTNVGPAADASAFAAEKKELVPGDPGAPRVVPAVTEGKEIIPKEPDMAATAGEKETVPGDLAISASAAGPGEGPLEIDPGALQIFWEQQLLPELKKQRKHIVHALLQEGAPFSYEKGVFTISLPLTHSVHKGRIESKEHSSYIESLLEQLLGRKTRLKILLKGKPGEDAQNETPAKEAGGQKNFSPVKAEEGHAGRSNAAGGNNVNGNNVEEGFAGLENADQDYANQNNAGQANTARGHTSQDSAGQNIPAWNNTAQNSANRNVADQGHAGQDHSGHGNAGQANAAWNKTELNSVNQHITDRDHTGRNNVEHGHVDQNDGYFLHRMLELFDGRLIETGVETLGSREFWSFNLDEINLDLSEEDEVPF